MDKIANEKVGDEKYNVEREVGNTNCEAELPQQRDTECSKDEKPKRKEDRQVNQASKHMNNTDNNDKYSALSKKYSEVVEENRKLQLALKQSEKRVQMITRENEQLQTERSKAVLTRCRLESLCRELQRQNKAIKEESLLKVREEEEKRKEVAAKFQTTLAEITSIVSQNNEKNAKLHGENMEISRNLKSVCEQVEVRKQQFDKILQQMKLEIKLAEAKLTKCTIEKTVEKQELMNENKQLLNKITEHEKRIKEMEAQEVMLRNQISVYTNKYDEFQDALTKSNEVFGGFNQEMEKMSKKIQKLEKETGLWKQRWERSHQALLEMAADKQARDAEIEGLNKKRLLLIELCKAFQTERASLMQQLKEKKNNSSEFDNPGAQAADQDSNLTEPAEDPIDSSQELRNSLSQAQESLMQDIATHEARKKGLDVISKDQEGPPCKEGSSKKKGKKKQRVKESVIENVTSSLVDVKLDSEGTNFKCEESKVLSSQENPIDMSVQVERLTDEENKTVDAVIGKEIQSGSLDSEQEKEKKREDDETVCTNELNNDEK